MSLVKLANGVVNYLAPYGAELSYYPEYSLPELELAHLTVIPGSVAYVNESRSLVSETYTVWVGLMQRATEDDIDILIEKMTRIARSFAHLTIDRWYCTKVEHKPMYVPEHLRERRQFSSVLELTFKLVK